MCAWRGGSVLKRGLCSNGLLTSKNGRNQISVKIANLSNKQEFTSLSFPNFTSIRLCSYDPTSICMIRRVDRLSMSLIMETVLVQRLFGITTLVSRILL